LTNERWKGKLAMAKPQFGTSATQAACLFEVLGAERAREFYKGLHQNAVALVPGNKQVAEGVAAGQFDVGITDTDDAIAEVEAGRTAKQAAVDWNHAADLWDEVQAFLRKEFAE